MTKKYFFVLTLIIIFLTSYTRYGLTQGATKEESNWEPVSAGPITTWTAPLCGKSTLVVQPFLIYNKIKGSFNNGGGFDALSEGDKSSQMQQLLFMQYGRTDTLEVDGQITLQENYAKVSGETANTTGLADSYLWLRYCLSEETPAYPSLTGIVQLKIPMGKFEKADTTKLGTDIMGTGSYDHGYGLIITKKAKPFIFHADAIYSFPMKVTVDNVDTQYGQYLNYDFGTEYFFGDSGFNLLLEFNGFWQGDIKLNKELREGTKSKYLLMGPGIGWSNDTIQTLLSYQKTVSGLNTDTYDNFVFTLIYTF